MAPVVIEKVNGKDVTCLEIGPPGLDAADVATASASGARRRALEVDFTPTTEGSSRLGMLRRVAGPDGVVAIWSPARWSPFPTWLTSRDHRDRLRR